VGGRPQPRLDDRRGRLDSAVTRSYHAFARFYDAVAAAGPEQAAYLRELIARHHPRARTVLELACGTGEVLAELEGDYDVTGLDVSPEMLGIAAAKLPGSRLVEADMTQFELNERFDVVLCVYDSINHLLDFAAWNELFARTHSHLNERGVLIFDAVTGRQFARLTSAGTVTRWFGDESLAVIEVRGDGADRVVWDIRVFEREADGRYRLHAEEIPEAAFPRDRIEQSLRAHFRRVSVRDRRRSRATVASERLYYIAVR
jgi:SAM-dependent methyltransferase